MALVFPIDPFPSQEYMGYSWDGEKWVCSGAGAGGGPQIGVIDGSNAAPGDVGEVILASNLGSTVVPGISSGNSPTLVSIELTAGDWDVNWMFFGTGQSIEGQPPRSFYMSSTVNGIDVTVTGCVLAGAGGSIAADSFYPAYAGASGYVRVSSSFPSIVGVRATRRFSPEFTMVFCQTFMKARRAR